MASVQERVAPLLQEVQSFHGVQQKRHGRNFAYHWTLVILALACSVLTTLGGILTWPHVSIALIGVASGATIVLHTALAIGDKAEFQRIIASEAANLLILLNDSALTDKSFEELRERFIELRRHADAQLPRGGGMDAVRNLPAVKAG